jgi:hypothetical protein
VKDVDGEVSQYNDRYPHSRAVASCHGVRLIAALCATVNCTSGPSGIECAATSTNFFGG